MRHGHEFGEKGDTGHISHGVLITVLPESPELLCIVPSEEVLVVLEEIFECVEVIVLDMAVAAAGMLEHEPHVVLAADSSPRLEGEHRVLRFLVISRLFVESTREGEVDADIRFDVFRNEIDDLLWVRIVPGIHMNEPHGMLRVNRSSALCVGHDADE